MASFHNSANNLLHPAHHDGSQLLSDDTSDYVPGPDVDEENTIDINPPDINVVDTPVVGLKHGCASSDIWTWFTNNANSHHFKSATCKYCNLHINHQLKHYCSIVEYLCRYIVTLPQYEEYLCRFDFNTSTV